MKTVIVGAGPTGMFLSVGLARRGHEVTLVDRDGGPSAEPNDWSRKGVMQFHHPHFFRPNVREAFRAEVPEMDAELVEAGAHLTPVNPFMTEFLGYRVRRSTLETVMRVVVAREHGVTLVTGHADSVHVEAGRATGVVVDGAVIEADLVLDASGRNGRFSDSLRAPAIGGDCGFAYVSRHYQLLPGAELGPTNAPPGWGGVYNGYLVIIFPQDAGIFQTLIVRASDDRELAKVRDAGVFDVVANAIPSIAEWIDPARSVPISAPMVGANLTNSYRGQLNERGELGVTGLIFVGDSVLTTNPAAGRGVTTGLMQSQQVLALLDKHGSDFATVAHEFDTWCTDNMKPWFHDHVAWDAGLLSRWRGEGIDFSKPLPSDLICSLAEVDPSVMPIVGAYFGMFAGPAVLRQLEDRAREQLQAGFRPKASDGPSRDELVDIIARVPVAAGGAA